MRKSLSMACCLLSFSLLVSCGDDNKDSDSSEHGTVRGTVTTVVEGTTQKVGLTVRDAIFGKYVQASQEYVEVTISDTADLCDAYTTGQGPKNATIMTLSFADVGTVVTPGQYDASIFGMLGNTGKLVQSGFTKLDAEGAPAFGDESTFAPAITGAVTLDSISATENGQARGSFDLNFFDVDADNLKGTFVADYCAAYSDSLSASNGAEE